VIVAGRIQWLGSTCSILNSISLFDTTTVRLLMHYDVTSGAPVLWISCKTESVVSLAARVGTGELYAAYGDTIYFYDLSNTNADWTPVLQYPGSVRFSSVFAHASGGLLMSVPDRVLYVSNTVMTSSALPAPGVVEVPYCSSAASL
jgi:hypothetical protein